MAGYPRPEGHHSLTPASIVPNASEVIAFLEKAFGAKVIDRYEGPGGSVAHAEVLISGSVLMIGEAGPDLEAMPIAISYYVEGDDTVDVVYQRALAAGATSLSPPQTELYGHRTATVKDAGGNRWSISAVVEQLTSDEMHRRMPDLMHVT